MNTSKMDVNLSLLERIKRKQEKQMTGISDIDQGLETHYIGKNVEDIGLHTNGIDDFRLDMNQQLSSDEDILVPETPSPVFSKKSRKNETVNINHREVKSDGDSVGKHTDRSKSKKDKTVKNKYNDSFHDILNTPSPLIADKKRHNNCMKSAAKMLKSIGDKYGYSSDILPDGEKATHFNSKQEERIIQRDAMERLKVMREKRKSRAEITPEKINSSNKFPKYASGYLGWPSESESSSSSDEDKTIPLRSTLSKRKPHHQYKSNNEARQKRDISQSNSRSIADLAKEQKTKSAKSSGSYNSICDISQGSSNKNSKIKPSDFFESLSMEDSLQNSVKNNYLSMGAKPKTKTSIKTKPLEHQVKSDKNNSCTSKNKIPINSNHDYNIWLSPSSILSQHELQTPDRSSNFSTIQTPETPDVTSIDTEVSAQIDAIPRVESPDLVLLGVTPPERSMNHQHNRRQRTGARAAELRKHRTSRHSVNRERTQIDQHEEDCVQLIEQMINDEDYARQLQEEMDKEFAFSLAQNQSMNELPVSLQPLPGYLPEGVYGHNFDFVHVNNIHHWHTPPRRRAVHNPRAGTMARNRRVSNVLDNIDVLDGGSGGFNGNYGVNLLNPGYAGGNNALESVEQRLLAILEDTPPRRGRRRGHYRNPRAFGVGIQSPIGDGNDYEALLQLAEQMGDVRRNGICDGLINRLPIKKYKKCEKSGSDPDECSICMSEYEENDCVRILPCFHRFHAGCVDKWLQNNASCPVCRVEVKLQ